MFIREKNEVLTVRIESAKLNSKTSRKIKHMMPNNREFNAENQDLTLQISVSDIYPGRQINAKTPF
jgi:hypothetical protein